MYRITECRKCGQSNLYGPICQSSQLCGRCHSQEENNRRIEEGKHCPSCSSLNYSEGIYYEKCYDCGYEQGY